MNRTIYVRSRFGSTTSWGTSSKKQENHGSEVSRIRTFVPSDDARDIAWKQSAKSPENPYTKVRQNEKTTPVFLIGSIDSSWEFATRHNPLTKYDFYDRLHRALEFSSQALRFPYREEKNQETISTLQKQKIQGSLILYITASLDPHTLEKLKVLTHHNDVIILHLLHPYERSPENEPWVLLESRIPSPAYKEALDRIQTEIRKKAFHLGGDCIEMLSSDDPVSILNSFFKKRYVR